jgi:hypothetical protein
MESASRIEGGISRVQAVEAMDLGTSGGRGMRAFQNEAHIMRSCMRKSLDARQTYISAEVTMSPRLMTWCASCHMKTHPQSHNHRTHTT